MTGTGSASSATAAGPSVTVVYDGLCNLCSTSMAVVARRLDSSVRFVPVQSAEGAAALRAAGLDALDPESFLVVRDGLPLQKSRAVIAVLELTGGGAKTLAVLLRLLPRGVADRLYGFIATNRYAWFGRRSTCFIPPHAHKARPDEQDVDPVLPAGP